MLLFIYFSFVFFPWTFVNAFSPFICFSFPLLFFNIYLFNANERNRRVKSDKSDTYFDFAHDCRRL